MKTFTDKNGNPIREDYNKIANELYDPNFWPHDKGQFIPLSSMNNFRATPQNNYFWEEIWQGREHNPKAPKKDLDSYGNEIHKGEMVYVADYKNMLDNDREPQEFICIAEKSKEKYIAYTPDYAMATSYKFCLKISSTEVKKSELQSQMEDLKAQVKEIEAKINEL